MHLGMAFLKKAKRSSILLSSPNLLLPIICGVCVFVLFFFFVAFYLQLCLVCGLYNSVQYNELLSSLVILYPFNFISRLK
jgi:hypothetical protein